MADYLEKLHTHAPLTIEVLSPLHVGDGKLLIKNLDFVVRANDPRTWVVDQEALWERTLTPAGDFDNHLLGRPAEELISDADFRGDPDRIFRYVMPGVPATNELRPFIKDAFDRLYLPGSTIKGLLRTLAVWGYFAARKELPDLSRLGKSRTFAAKPVESDVMGPNPNLDLFRALHIADTDPINLDRLRAARVNIYPTGDRERTGVMTNVEAVVENTLFTSRLTIEEYGFANRAASDQLEWSENARKFLDRLVRFGKVFAGRRLAQEIKYYPGRADGRGVLGTYSRLVRIQEQLDNRQFLAQLGWGAGWNSKTLNDLLTAEPGRFAQLVKQYHLTRFSESFKPGDRFPSSRHLTIEGGSGRSPMGWVLVTIG